MCVDVPLSRLVTVATNAPEMSLVAVAEGQEPELTASGLDQDWKATRAFIDHEGLVGWSTSCTGGSARAREGNTIAASASAKRVSRLIGIASVPISSRRQESVGSTCGGSRIGRHKSRSFYADVDPDQHLL